MSIQPIGLAPAGVPSVPLASETDLAQPIGGTPEVSFGDVLQGALRTTVEAGHEATMKADALAQGVGDDLHGTMISAKEAEISLKLIGAVRNKLLDAFHELWRTNV